jgi:hypothetical protein
VGNRAQGAQLRDASGQALQPVAVGDVEAHGFHVSLRPVAGEPLRCFGHGSLVSIDEDHDVDHVDEPRRARRSHPASCACHDSDCRHDSSAV